MEIIKTREIMKIMEIITREINHGDNGNHGGNKRIEIIENSDKQ